MGKTKLTAFEVRTVAFEGSPGQKGARLTGAEVFHGVGTVICYPHR